MPSGGGIHSIINALIVGQPESALSTEVVPDMPTADSFASEVT